MKIILSLLILISLFSYLLAGTISCPSFNYICCSLDSFDSCKCFNLAVKKKCEIKVICDKLSQKPIFTKDPNNMTSNCNINIDFS